MSDCTVMCANANSDNAKEEEDVAAGQDKVEEIPALAKADAEALEAEARAVARVDAMIAEVEAARARDEEQALGEERAAGEAAHTTQAESMILDDNTQSSEDTQTSWRVEHASHCCVNDHHHCCPNEDEEDFMSSPKRLCREPADSKCESADSKCEPADGKCEPAKADEEQQEKREEQDEENEQEEEEECHQPSPTDDDLLAQMEQEQQRLAEAQKKRTAEQRRAQTEALKLFGLHNIVLPWVEDVNIELCQRLRDDLLTTNDPAHNPAYYSTSRLDSAGASEVEAGREQQPQRTLLQVGSWKGLLEKQLPWRCRLATELVAVLATVVRHLAPGSSACFKQQQQLANAAQACMQLGTFITNANRRLGACSLLELRAKLGVAIDYERSFGERSFGSSIKEREDMLQAVQMLAGAFSSSGANAKLTEDAREQHRRDQSGGGVGCLLGICYLYYSVLTACYGRTKNFNPPTLVPLKVYVSQQIGEYQQVVNYLRSAPELCTVVALAQEGGTVSFNEVDLAVLPSEKPTRAVVQQFNNECVFVLYNNAAAADFCSPPHTLHTTTQLIAATTAAAKVAALMPQTGAAPTAAAAATADDLLVYAAVQNSLAQEEEQSAAKRRRDAADATKRAQNLWAGIPAATGDGNEDEDEDEDENENEENEDDSMEEEE